MVGSLWTGISGLSTQQAALDNESHNIANVNTIGYKASRMSFADQMYQDSIGKGSKVLDVEKVFSQGNMKATGVAYDMALEGSGFFAVMDPNASGSSEEFYTRAGNFRMGENGTLQDANMYDVVGWAISDVDPTSDVSTTNSNIVYFTNDYNQIAGNQIVKKDGIIETITGKFTNYQETAKSDEDSVISGLGYKSMSSKIRDTELLISEYQDKLSKYADDPEANSSPSIAQVSALGLPGAGTSSMTTESDQLYVYINGEKVSVNYVETTATQNITDGDYDGDGTSSSATLDNDDDILASRIATYKALADKISEKPGLIAYIADPSTVDLSTTTTIKSSTFGRIEGSTTSYSNSVGSEPIIVIESLVPGKEFVVGDAGEYIASTKNEIPASRATITEAVEGTGYGAVESARDAMVKAGAGFQRDVWTSSELPTVMSGDTIEFSLVNPDDPNNPFTLSMTEGTTAITYDAQNEGTLTDISSDFSETNKVDAMVQAINGHSEMSQLVTAHNYNGRLVVETINTNPGGTFVAGISYDGISTDSDNAVGSASAITDGGTIPDGAGTIKGLTAEVFTATFSGVEVGGDTTFQFDTMGAAVTIPAGSDAQTVASLVAGQAYGNWTAVDNGNGTVTFTASTAGAIADAAAADFNLSAADISVSVNIDTQGIDLGEQDTVTLPATIEPDERMVVRFTQNGVNYTAVAREGEDVFYYKNSVDDQWNSVALTSAPLAAGTIDDAFVQMTGALGTAVTGTVAGVVENNSIYDVSNFNVYLKSSDETLNRSTTDSVNSGADAEFLELTTTLNQEASRGALQLRLDNLGISDSAFGEFSVDSTGLVTMKQDGATFAVGQVAVAMFNNERGLKAEGNNLYSKTAESGNAIYNTNNDKAAAISGKTLELSTADLSESLVNLMVFQRAFEANSKSITTSDTILNTLIQLKAR